MILTLKEQCTDIAHAMKMKKLEFKQESVWYWVIGKEDGMVGIMQGEPEKDTMLDLENPTNGKYYIQKIKEYYSAYTVGELGELLPENLDLISNPTGKSWFNVSKITSIKGQVIWTVGYGNMKGEIFLFENANTEVEARAKVLIFLKENDYI